MEHHEVYVQLVQAGQSGQFLYYSQVAKVLGIDMDNPHFATQVGRVLDEINQDEVANGRPMLSAIVVSKDTMLPGKGFFTLGQQLHRVQPDDDEISFALREIKRTHEYWLRHREDSPGRNVGPG